jgi:hypothetical protein
MAVSPGKWDSWRYDWVIMWHDPHDRLVLPTGAPIGNNDHWEETPRLQPAIEPMIKSIRFLVGHGLLLMMVLADFQSRRIAPSSHVSA